MDVFSQPAFSSHDNELPLEPLHSPVAHKNLNFDSKTALQSQEANPSDLNAVASQKLSPQPSATAKTAEENYGTISPNDGFFAPEIRIDISGPADGPTPPILIQPAASPPLVSDSTVLVDQASSIVGSNLQSNLRAADLEFSDELPNQPGGNSTEKKPLEDEMKPTAASTAEKSTTVIRSDDCSSKKKNLYKLFFFRLLMVLM